MKTPSLYETYRAWNELYDDGNRFVGYTEDVMFRAMKIINAAIPDQIKYCHVMDQVFLHEDEYLPFSQFHLSFTNEKAPEWKNIQPYAFDRQNLHMPRFPQTLYDRVRRLAKYDFELIRPDCEWYWLYPNMEICPYFDGKLLKKIEWDREPIIFLPVPLEGQDKIDVDDLMQATGRSHWPEKFQLVDRNGKVKVFYTETGTFYDL